MPSKLAKLDPVALREAFPSEVKDLSKWVQANIDQLNAATGLQLSSADTEQPAGDFSVDLIAEDDSKGKVIIENQHGKSDHDHLGKILTYLTPHEAKAAVWIVENPRPEHVNAISWLNQSSPAEFYLVKVQAFKIGDSDPAPLLTLIVGPSAESKIIAGDKEKYALRYTEREQFWKGLLEAANKKNPRHTHSGRSPTKAGSLAGPSGVAGINFTYVVLEHEARVEVWIARGIGAENKEIFKRLLDKKDEIEREFHDRLDWQPLEESDACRIQITTNLGGYRDPEKWPEIYDWLIDKMASLDRAFRPAIAALHL